MKAKWEVVTYKITYELNNGTGDKDNPTSYTIETDDFTIKDPVSGPGETPNFVGWYSDKDFTKPAVTTITKGSTGNLSFYAKWSAKSTFTVTFNFVGVEGSDSVKVEDGEALTSAQLESVKSKISSDYVFVDFYTNKECTTKFDVTTTITADSTVYVKVKVNEIKKFTVTFESNGGSKVAAAEVKDGEKVKKPADPTKDGYTFKGWFNGDKEYDFGTAVTANITLKAKWATSLWAPKDTAEKEVSCTMPGYQFAVSYEENETYGKVLVLTNKSDVGTYDKMTLTFKNPKNLSGKLLKFDLWGDAEDKAPKVLIISGDKAQSEGYAPQIHTANAWGTGTTTLDECKAAWSSDNSIVAADLTAVTSIQIAFQNAAANMKYSKIYITDAEGANEEIIWSANALSVEDPASWSNATVSYVEDATYGSVYKVETTSEVNYPVTKIVFPSPAKNFSAYEYLQITLKASAAPASDNEKIKVSIFTDDAHGSEHNGCNISAEDVGQYKAFSLKLADFWTAYGLKEAADLSKISNLKIEFGKYVGTVEIAEISLY